MKRLLIYNIISYILIPVGVLFGIGLLLALLFAAKSIPFLISLFITGATVIYIFSSFIFLQKGIQRQVALKRSLKDLITVNGYVALFFAVYTLIQSITILSDPKLVSMLVESSREMQKTFPVEDAAAMDAAYFARVIKGMLYAMIGLATLLLFHIFTTFRLVKRYKELFVRE